MGLPRVNPFGIVASVLSLTVACDSGAWVAKAGPYTLTAEEFAETLAGWENLSLRETEVERWAHRWVEWTLFADRIAGGDSLTDSATVYQAVWPEVHELLFRGYQARVLADSLDFTPAKIDSAYAVGEYRLMYHILWRIRLAAGESERQLAFRNAEAARARLAAGARWAVENEASSDLWARERGGSLGVVGRGDMLPVFDSVTFSLAPGELSGTFETEHGVHVAWRPPLEEVREEFTEGLRDVRLAEIDAAFQLELPVRYDLTFVDGAAAVTQRASERPLAVIMSDERIAAYRGGEFTVADFIRRLRMEPPNLRFDIRSGTEEFILEQLGVFLTRELTVQTALDAGVALTEAQDAELRFGHRQNLADVQENMQLDRFLDDEATGGQRRAQVEQAVREQFAAVARMERIPRFVPTYLSDVLRRESSWRVSDRGIQTVVQRATALREASGANAPEG